MGCLFYEVWFGTSRRRSGLNFVNRMTRESNLLGVVSALCLQKILLFLRAAAVLCPKYEIYYILLV